MKTVVIIVDCLLHTWLKKKSTGLKRFFFKKKTLYLESQRLLLFEINWLESQFYVHFTGLLEAVGSHSQDSSASTGNWCLKPPPLLSDGFSRSKKIYVLLLFQTIFLLWQKHEHCCLQGSVSVDVYS